MQFSVDFMPTRMIILKNSSRNGSTLPATVIDSIYSYIPQQQVQFSVNN
jgi:hypothetical protein